MADAKQPKSSVEFEHPAKGPYHCFRCVHFIQKDQRCKEVQGIIRNMDWCRLWERKTPTYQRARKILNGEK